MNISDLSKNNKILARYPLADMNGKRKALIDVNNNQRMDLDSMSLGTEPVLSTSVQQLREFAELNGKDGLLTKDCVGELDTRSYLKSGDELLDQGSTGTLTDYLSKLSPFKLDEGTEINWAIDPKPKGFAPTGDLYLYTAIGDCDPEPKRPDNITKKPSPPSRFPSGNWVRLFS